MSPYRGRPPGRRDVNGEARASVEERLTALHERLAAAVEDLVQGEAWQQMLRVAARFPTYSPSNILLISIQRPRATRVAGMRTWNNLGRHVCKGEKGIAILAPCIYRGREPNVSADASVDPAAPQRKPERAAVVPDDTDFERKDVPRGLRGFKIVHVWDVEQTEGTPIPTVEPQLLTGQAPEVLWDGLTNLLATSEFTVERGDCSGVNGYTDFATRTVRVRDDVDSLQAVKTLAHEAGHVRGEHETRFADSYGRSITCRGIAEVEAESVAFLVTSMAGLDVQDYSVPYVAGWSGGDVRVLRETAARAITIAGGIGSTLGLTAQREPTVPSGAATQRGSAPALWPLHLTQPSAASL